MSGKSAALLAFVMVLLTAAAAAVFFATMRPRDSAVESGRAEGFRFGGAEPAEPAPALPPPAPAAALPAPPPAALPPASSLGYVRSAPGFQEEERRPDPALAAAADEARKAVGVSPEQKPRPVKAPAKPSRRGRSRPSLQPMDSSGFRSLERKEQRGEPLDQFKQYLK